MAAPINSRASYTRAMIFQPGRPHAGQCGLVLASIPSASCCANAGSIVMRMFGEVCGLKGRRAGTSIPSMKMSAAKIRPNEKDQTVGRVKFGSGGEGSPQSLSPHLFPMSSINHHNLLKNLLQISLSTLLTGFFCCKFSPSISIAIVGMRFILQRVTLSSSIQQPYEHSPQISNDFRSGYSVLGTRYSVLGTRYSVLGTRYSVLNPLPITTCFFRGGCFPSIDSGSSSAPDLCHRPTILSAPTFMHQAHPQRRV